MWSEIIKKLTFFFRQWHGLFEQVERHWRLSEKRERLRGSLARNLRLTSQNLACCPAPCRDRTRQKKEISRRVVGAKGDTDWLRLVPLGFQHGSTFPEPRLAQNSHQQSSDAPLPRGMETKVGPLQDVQWVLPLPVPPSTYILYL